MRPRRANPSSEGHRCCWSQSIPTATPGSAYAPKQPAPLTRSLAGHAIAQLGTTMIEFSLHVKLTTQQAARIALAIMLLL